MSTRLLLIDHLTAETRNRLGFWVHSKQARSFPFFSTLIQLWTRRPLVPSLPSRVQCYPSRRFVRHLGSWSWWAPPNPVPARIFHGLNSCFSAYFPLSAFPKRPLNAARFFRYHFRRMFPEFVYTFHHTWLVPPLSLTPRGVGLLWGSPKDTSPPSYALPRKAGGTTKKTTK